MTRLEGFVEAGMDIADTELASNILRGYKSPGMCALNTPESASCRIAALLFHRSVAPAAPLTTDTG